MDAHGRAHASRFNGEEVNAREGGLGEGRPSSSAASCLRTANLRLFPRSAQRRAPKLGYVASSAPGYRRRAQQISPLLVIGSVRRHETGLEAGPVTRPDEGARRGLGGGTRARPDLLVSGSLTQE
jgi:hypothetical protein